MKRRKKLWIMGAVLGLVLALTVTVALIDHKVEKIQESGETILEIPVESVTALSWDYQGETLSFTKDDSWHYAGDEEFPVSTTEIELMLEPFRKLAAAFRIEKVEDYGQYGFDKPTCTIQITAGDQDYQIRLGAFSKMDDQRYVDIGDGNVYLVFHDPMMEFDKPLSSVIANDKAPYLDSADKITFSGAENYSIVKQPEDGKSYREDDTYFAQLDGRLLPLNPKSVESYLSNLTLIGLSDYQTYTASQEDLSVYGLDKPELTIQVDYTQTDEDTDQETKETYLLHIARDPEALKKAEEAKEKEGAEPVNVPVYARVGDSELVYEISNPEYEQAIACGYNDLRHFEIFPASIEDITKLNISLDGKQYLIESTVNEKDENTRDFTFQGQEVTASEILSSIRSLYADEFTQEAPSGKLEIKLELTLNEEDTVTVELYRLDGNQCLAKVDGEVIAKIPRSQVVDLVEKINAIVLNPVEETTEATEEA